MGTDARRRRCTLLEEGLVLGLHGSLLVVPLIWADDASRCAEPAAAAFLALATLFCFAERAAQRPREQETLPARGVDALAATATGLVLLSVFWLSLSSHLASRGAAVLDGTLARAAGVLLMTGGIALRWTAIRALGPLFVSLPRVWPGAALVRRGPYRRMRHPSEAGLLLVACGAALLLASWHGLALCTFVLAPLCLLRAHREERVLRRGFGDAYRDYACEVRAWIP